LDMTHAHVARGGGEHRPRALQRRSAHWSNPPLPMYQITLRLSRKTRQMFVAATTQLLD
jgi:hypothetical protein